MIKSACVFLLLSITPANVQFAMPMYPPQPQMYAPPIVAIAPPPPPMFISVDCCGDQTTKKTTTTTTTTTPRAMAIAVPIPVPLAVQVGIPAYPPPAFCYAQPRPKSCPPCPPCQCQPTCTPGFFAYCSPCHLKCRCRNGDSVPVPLPPMPPLPIRGPAYPVPAPIPPYGPNLIVMPYPPMIMPQGHGKDSDSASDQQSSDSSSDASCGDTDSSDKWLRQGSNNNKKHHKRSRHRKDKGQDRHVRRKPKQRRHRKRMRPSHNMDRNTFRFNRRVLKDNSGSDDNLVKPVLSYIGRNGDVKIQRSISAVDAAKLMSDDQQDIQNINVAAKEDPSGKSQVLMIASDYNDRGEKSKYSRQLRFRSQGEPEVLNRGRKELNFKPPKNKRISNLSVSFQIT